MKKIKLLRCFFTVFLGSLLFQWSLEVHDSLFWNWDVSCCVRGHVYPVLHVWIQVQRAEKHLHTDQISMRITSKLFRLEARVLLQQLVEQQERVLLTHDALRAWELCGLKVGIFAGSFNWLWQQEMTSAACPGGWEQHDHLWELEDVCMCWHLICKTDDMSHAHVRADV